VQKKKILRAVIVDRHYSSDTSTLSGLVEEITSSNVSDHFHEEQQSILQSCGECISTHQFSLYS